MTEQIPEVDTKPLCFRSQRNSRGKKTRIFPLMGILIFLMTMLILVFVQAPSMTIAAPPASSSVMVIALPSPTVTSTPNTAETIADLEHRVFDPILAALNFTAALLIGVLILLLVRRLIAFALSPSLNIPRIAQRGCCRAKPDLMSESRSEPDVEPVRDGRNSRMESKKGRREKELRNSQEKRP